MLHVIVRAVTVYFVVLAAMRVMGKREIGNLSPFDLVVAISSDKRILFVKWQETTPEPDPEELEDEDEDDYYADEDGYSFEENREHFEDPEHSSCYTGSRKPGLYKARLVIDEEESDLEILEPLHVC